MVLRLAGLRFLVARFFVVVFFLVVRFLVARLAGLRFLAGMHTTSSHNVINTTKSKAVFPLRKLFTHICREGIYLHLITTKTFFIRNVVLHTHLFLQTFFNVHSYTTHTREKRSDTEH